MWHFSQIPLENAAAGVSSDNPPTNLGYSASPQVIAASSGADKVQELIVTNLLPITELPLVVQSGDTSMRKKGEIKELTDSTHVPPFMLRGGKLYTFSDLHDIDNPLEKAIEPKTLKDVMFSTWFNNEETKRWGIELLNLVFRQHCWDRYLRFDHDGHDFSFHPLGRSPRESSGTLMASVLVR